MFAIFKNAKLPTSSLSTDSGSGNCLGNSLPTPENNYSEPCQPRKKREKEDQGSDARDRAIVAELRISGGHMGT